MMLHSQVIVSQSCDLAQNGEFGGTFTKLLSSLRREDFKSAL